MKTLIKQLETFVQQADISAVFKLLDHAGKGDIHLLNVLKQEFMAGKESGMFYHRLLMAIRQEITEDIPNPTDFEEFYVQYLQQKPVYEQITDRTRQNRGIGTSELVQDRTVAHLDERALETMWLKPKTIETLEKYNIPYETLNPHERLVILRLAENGHLFKGTFLALGKHQHVHTVCPTAVETVLIYFKGTTRTHVLVSEMATGTLIEQFEKSMLFLKKHIPLLRDRGKNEDAYEIPMEALREFVVNAFVHRDYSYEPKTHIYIEIYDDKVVIKNAGRFPAEIDMQNINTSVPINSTIMGIFHLHGYMERMGTGIAKAQDLLIKSGLKKADIEQLDKPIIVCITIERPLYKAINALPEEQELYRRAIALLEKKDFQNFFELAQNEAEDQTTLKILKKEFATNGATPELIERLKVYASYAFQKHTTL